MQVLNVLQEILLGDSHAKQWQPRYQYLVDAGFGSQMPTVILHIMYGCPPLPPDVGDLKVFGYGTSLRHGSVWGGDCSAAARAKLYDAIDAYPNVTAVVISAFWAWEMGGLFWAPTSDNADNRAVPHGDARPRRRNLGRV